MPADFAGGVPSQLEQMARNDLKERRLSHGEIVSTSTPRRIVLLIKGIASSATDFKADCKGPPSAQAFKDGVPTQAAIGFAKRFDITTDQLQIRDTSKGPFVFASILEPGESSFKLLRDLIPLWISNLQGRRFMRWGKGERRFTRPIRWIVALLDDQLIDLSLSGVDPQISSGNRSKGHRLYNQSLVIPSSDDYLKTLKNAGVYVNREERRRLIESLVSESGRENNAQPDLSDSLLEELTDLVESPSLIQGEFDKTFLDLPAELLSTVMKNHQRYVPLFRHDSIYEPLALSARRSLLSKFICISNGLLTSSKNIAKGNQRVLRARLADAKFFIDVDLEERSLERVDKLSHVTFSEGLGSLKDRVLRIEWVAKMLLEELNLNQQTIVNTTRAAYLSKHDLVSQIVGEFPELQGIMGGKYLLAEGEENEVALAVAEQYLPKSANGKLPQSDAGSVLALADRIELLLSIYSKGERPTGSSDPYALRRAGNGIVQILWTKCWHLNLQKLLEKSSKYWGEILPNLGIETSNISDQLKEFMRQRIISLLEDQKIDGDLVQAVAGETVHIDRILDNIIDVKLRINLLASMRSKGELNCIHSVVTRAARLAEKGELPSNIFGPKDTVDPSLFEKSSETELFNLINLLEPIVCSTSESRYTDLAKNLASGSKVLEEFFDGETSVLVMDNNPLIRANRLNLLGILRNQASVLADFNLING